MFGSRVGRNVAPTGLLWGSALVLALSMILILPLAQAGAPAADVAGRPVASGVPVGPVTELSAPTVVTRTAAPVPLVISPETVPPQVLASVNVGSGPAMAVYDAGNGYIYVASSIANTVSILNGTSVVATVSVSNATYSVGDPVYLVYDPGNGFVYVVDRYSFETDGGAVSVLNGTLLIGVLPIGLMPSSGVYDPADGFVYVTEAGGGHVAVISGTSVVADLLAGSDPVAAVYDPSDTSVYVANRGSNDLTALVGSTVSGTVPVGIGPSALAYDANAATVVVANNGSGNVTLVSALTPLGSVATGNNPTFVTWDALNGYAYVSNRNSSDVTVLNGLTPVTAVPTGGSPGASAFGSSTGFVYVTDSSAAEITVIDGTVVLGNVTVGSTPSSGAWDPATSDLYVTNADSHNVSVVAIAYAVTFNETGLPSASSWSVTVGAKTHTTTSAATVFGELPGAHSYAILGPSGYRVVSSVPASPVEVTDAAVTVAVTFGPVSSQEFGLTFVESGLSSMCGHSTEWSVTVGNVTESSTSTTIVFSEANGTYNYTVVGPTGETVVSETPASPVTIAGAPVTVEVTFGKGGSHSSLFTITFRESGLPWGTEWCVSLGSTTLCSTSSQIAFGGLASGTYSFTVGPVSGYTAQPSSGTVTIYGHNAYVRIHFSSQGGGHHCGGGGWDGSSSSTAPPA